MAKAGPVTLRTCKGEIDMWIIPVIIVVPLIVFMCMFNTLVVRKNRVRNVFSTVDVMLKKRYDLVGNLVAAVKGFRQHQWFDAGADARENVNTAEIFKDQG